MSQDLQPQLDTFELLELEIDLRLTDLWRSADEQKRPWTLELVALYMRAAYGKGYCDSLAEPDRGQLCSEHGFSIPQPAPTHLRLADAGGPLAQRGLRPAPPLDPGWSSAQAA